MMRAIYFIPIFLLAWAMPVMAQNAIKPLEESVLLKNSGSINEAKVALTVYKSKSCGCCKNWIAHLNDNGIHTTAIDIVDLGAIKSKYHIKPNLRSCHTAVSLDGFVFEGHVPAKYIKQFLSEDHANDVSGLSVPAMPVGSPGMEMKNMFHKYNIELLTTDDQPVTYQHINNYAKQF